MPLTDSHAHIDLNAFDKDRNQILDNAKKAEIGYLLNIALGPQKSIYEKAYSMIEPLDGYFLALGIHPHDASKASDGDYKVIREFSKREKVKAIGETGLDYHYENSPRDTQKSVFQRQLELAIDLKLPVSIHSRDAFEDTFSMTKASGIFKKSGGVLHCFTGNAAQAQAYLDLGAYISFSGIVTFKNAKDIQEAAVLTPADRILIETDCPFLAPVPHRGKRNEPAFLRETARFLADLRKMPLAKFIDLTTENARRLFQF